VTWREEQWRPSSLRIAPRFFFISIFALLVIILGCWTYASPLVAGPDEQAHMIRAYALDHGQIGTPTTPPNKVLVNFNVPTSVYYTKIYSGCWQFIGTHPATCTVPWNTSTTPIVTNDYVGHYPPLYYAIVGIGGLYSPEPPGLYAMRLLSGALSATMLALAAFVIARWGRRRSMVMGLYVAVTPLVYFLGSVVNPSGFEISTAICIWTILVIIALDYRDAPPRQLLILLGIVSVIFTLIRGLSPFWLLLVVVIFAILMSPRHLIDLVRRRRDVQYIIGAVIVSCLVAATWILTQGTLNVLPVGFPVPPTAGFVAVIKLVLQQVPFWVRQCVGVLGWLDTMFPHFVYQTWYFLVPALVLIALVRGDWSQRIALSLVSGLALVVPVLIVARQAHVLGIVWQGRDSMPLTVGIVVLAAALVSRPGATNPWSRLLMMATVCAIALVNVVAFYANLKRYAVGRNGPRLFFLHNQGWSPPTGQVPTLVVFGLATFALAALLVTWIWHFDEPAVGRRGPKIHQFGR
jgi:hypothetical protein